MNPSKTNGASVTRLHNLIQQVELSHSCVYPQAIKTIFINYSLQVGPLAYTFEHPVFSVGSNVYSHLSSMGQKQIVQLVCLSWVSKCCF